MGGVILGVAGGSGSGKSTVAREILRAVGPERITFLAQDNYYTDVPWESDHHLLAHNFDHPDSFDTDLFLGHLAALKRGEAIDLPIYDFVHHRRTGETRRIEPRPVILVEGILLFVDARLRELLDFKVFVDTDSDVRLVRRIQRDMTERGRAVGDILRQYMTTVRPMHLEFVEPSMRYADVIVPEGGGNRVALEMVVARLEQLLTPARTVGDDTLHGEKRSPETVS